MQQTALNKLFGILSFCVLAFESVPLIFVFVIRHERAVHQKKKRKRMTEKNVTEKNGSRILLSSNRQLQTRNIGKTYRRFEEQ